MNKNYDRADHRAGRSMTMTEKNEALIAEARDALERINTNAFDPDLLFQYRGGVLGRELTLIVRDLADALEAAAAHDAATEARIERWMQLVGKGVEERMTAEAERDAALARVEELEADMERCEGLKAAHMRSVHETVKHNEELLARIAEAAKLHRPDWSDWGIDHPEEGASCSCGANYSYDECPTRIALGLNEGDNDEV